MRRVGALAFGAAAVLAFAFAFACTRRHGPPPPPAPNEADPIAHLRSFETARRSEARFLETAPQDRAFGADPYDLAAMANGRLAGILRGRDALVVLDAASSRVEIARAPTPRSPSAVAVYEGVPSESGVLRPNDVLVASEIEPLIAHYRLVTSGAATTIERLPDITIDGVVGARDIATGPEGVVYVVEEHDDRLVTLRWASGSSSSLSSASRVDRKDQVVRRGPLRLSRTKDALFVMSLLDHSISAFPVDRSGAVPVTPTSVASIDGPYWGMDAIDLPPTSGSGSSGGGGPSEVLLVAGGAEDHPLDRRGGFFGYVDSFVYAYRYTARTGELTRTASINVSELGLIVPKGIALRRSGGANGAELDAFVTSYGGAMGAHLVWSDGANAPPRANAVRIQPGVSALIASGGDRGFFVGANPLLDAWVAIQPTEPNETQPATIVHPSPSSSKKDGNAGDDDTRTDRERLGEALFFTGLMAPTASSDGSKSRFSCETCHFEGYVDGRVHHTGRGDIHATTKPLVGLFNNRPHFSRALDPDLSSIAENEFRVAGAPSPADPHFDVDANDPSYAWLTDLGIAKRKYDAAELRLSLMAFLMTWTHRTNPRAARAAASPRAQMRGGSTFSSEERTGAMAFRDRCERCHEARAAADDRPSRVPFDRWESLVLGDSGNSPIVWASDAYEKTGVLPYVHERGARVPSLRRVYKKRPYFTNGSAPDIMTVLRRARFTPSTFTHDAPADHAGAGAGEGEALDESTARALAAFIDLL